MTKLYIVRHGNTFDKGDTLLRVGKRTDLPLSKSGRAQAERLGNFILANNLKFNAIFCSNLKRTHQTAEIALKKQSSSTPNSSPNVPASTIASITPNEIFDEIDYGPDEGKAEEEVIARLGRDALEQWDKAAIVPNGWLINPKEVIENWRKFADSMAQKYPNGNILVVTSNGIARFAPYLTGDFENFKENHKIKLATGSISCLSLDLNEDSDDKINEDSDGKIGVIVNNNWKVNYWNKKPE